MDKRIILPIIFLMFLMPLASANIMLHLQQHGAQDATPGEILKIPADINNNGMCPIDCFYKYPDFPSGIDNKIGSNIQGRLDFAIQLKAPSQPSKIEVKAVCTEQKSNVCLGNTYEAVDYFEFFTTSGNTQKSMQPQTPISPMNPVNPTTIQGQQSSSATKDSGSTADHVGQFIGLVFVIIVAIALFIFIIFGFYRLIKKLFFGKDKEKMSKEELEGKRKLSAIMFTDMKGYSREMNRDEEKTLKKLWRYEKAMKEIVKEHDGRVVKTIGDAIMGDFDSAVNAVKAALEIQSLLKKEDIQIRIGIHIGDVIHKAGDVFGDGVNIASRIESICEPGQIYVSEDVYNQVKGKIRANFENLGSRPLKNIDHPPKVYRLK